ncbi:hypothetical protein ABK040_008049 [Willaertia magna]
MSSPFPSPASTLGYNRKHLSSTYNNNKKKKKLKRVATEESFHSSVLSETEDVNTNRRLFSAKTVSDNLGLDNETEDCFSFQSFEILLQSHMFFYRDAIHTMFNDKPIDWENTYQNFVDHSHYNERLNKKRQQMLKERKKDVENKRQLEQQRRMDMNNLHYNTRPLSTNWSYAYESNSDVQEILKFQEQMVKNFKDTMTDTRAELFSKVNVDFNVSQPNNDAINDEDLKIFCDVVLAQYKIDKGAISTDDVDDIVNKQEKEYLERKQNWAAFIIQKHWKRYRLLIALPRFKKLRRRKTLKTVVRTWVNEMRARKYYRMRLLKNSWSSFLKEVNLRYFANQQAVEIIQRNAQQLDSLEIKFPHLQETTTKLKNRKLFENVVKKVFDGSVMRIMFKKWLDYTQTQKFYKRVSDRIIKNHSRHLKKLSFSLLRVYAFHTKRHKNDDSILVKSCFKVLRRYAFCSSSEKKMIQRAIEIKKKYYLLMWKRIFIQEKLLQNSATIRLIGKRTEGLLTYYTIDHNDEIQFSLISKYLKLKHYYLKSKYFKCFIGSLYYQRIIDIKRKAFDSLRQYYKERLADKLDEFEAMEQAILNNNNTSNNEPSIGSPAFDVVTSKKFTGEEMNEVQLSLSQMDGYEETLEMFAKFSENFDAIVVKKTDKQNIKLIYNQTAGSLVKFHFSQFDRKQELWDPVILRRLFLILMDFFLKRKRKIMERTDLIEFEDTDSDRYLRRERRQQKLSEAKNILSAFSLKQSNNPADIDFDKLIEYIKRHIRLNRKRLRLKLLADNQILIKYYAKIAALRYANVNSNFTVAMEDVRIPENSQKDIDNNKKSKEKALQLKQNMAAEELSKVQEGRYDNISVYTSDDIVDTSGQSISSFQDLLTTIESDADSIQERPLSETPTPKEPIIKELINEINSSFAKRDNIDYIPRKKREDDSASEEEEGLSVSANTKSIRRKRTDSVTSQKDVYKCISSNKDNSPTKDKKKPRTKTTYKKKKKATNVLIELDESKSTNSTPSPSKNSNTPDSIDTSYSGISESRLNPSEYIPNFTKFRDRKSVQSQRPRLRPKSEIIKEMLGEGDEKEITSPREKKSLSPEKLEYKPPRINSIVIEDTGLPIIPRLESDSGEDKEVVDIKESGKSKKTKKKKETQKSIFEPQESQNIETIKGTTQRSLSNIPESKLQYLSPRISDDYVNEPEVDNTSHRSDESISRNGFYLARMVAKHEIIEPISETSSSKTYQEQGFVMLHPTTKKSKIKSLVGQKIAALEEELKKLDDLPLEERSSKKEKIHQSYLSEVISETNEEIESKPKSSSKRRAPKAPLSTVKSFEKEITFTQQYLEDIISLSSSLNVKATGEITELKKVIETLEKRQIEREKNYFISIQKPESSEIPGEIEGAEVDDLNELDKFLLEKQDAKTLEAILQNTNIGTPQSDISLVQTENSVHLSHLLLDTDFLEQELNNDEIKFQHRTEEKEQRMQRKKESIYDILERMSREAQNWFAQIEEMVSHSDKLSALVEKRKQLLSNKNKLISIISISEENLKKDVNNQHEWNRIIEETSLVINQIDTQLAKLDEFTDKELIETTTSERNATPLGLNKVLLKKSKSGVRLTSSIPSLRTLKVEEKLPELINPGFTLSARSETYSSSNKLKPILLPVLDAKPTLTTSLKKTLELIVGTDMDCIDSSDDEENNKEKVGSVIRPREKLIPDLEMSRYIEKLITK